MDDIYGYDNAPPESGETLALSVGIGRIEVQPTVEENDLFESMIEVTLDPDLPSSSTTPTPTKRIRLSEKQKLQTEKIEFTREMILLKEENKRQRMMEKEASKEKRLAEKIKIHKEKKQWHAELMALLTKKNT